MGNQVKVVLNRSGVRELLKSEEIKRECKEFAESVCARAGDGYVVEPRNYPERSGYAVRADSMRAIRSNSKNNTLIKALHG